MKHSETLDQILQRAAESLFPDQAKTPKQIGVHSKSSDGDTPLHVATLWGDRHAVRVLLDAGADVTAKGDMSCCPLYYAVMTRNVQVAELMLQHGANPDAKNELNFTPRSLAEHNSDKLMIALFRQYRKLER